MVGKVERTGRGRGNYNQDILCEGENLFSIKGGKFPAKSSLFKKKLVILAT